MICVDMLWPEVLAMAPYFARQLSQPLSYRSARNATRNMPMTQIVLPLSKWRDRPWRSSLTAFTWSDLIEFILFCNLSNFIKSSWIPNFKTLYYFAVSTVWTFHRTEATNNCWKNWHSPSKNARVLDKSNTTSRKQNGWSSSRAEL